MKIIYEVMDQVIEVIDVMDEVMNEDGCSNG